MPKKSTTEPSELTEARRLCVQSLLSRNNLTEAALARKMGLSNANLFYNFRHGRSNRLETSTLIKMFSVLTVYTVEDQKLLGIYVPVKQETQPENEGKANLAQASTSRESELINKIYTLQHENAEQLQLLGKMTLTIERLQRSAATYLSTTS